VPEGTSVMRAAAMPASTIPKLCATDSSKPFGSCRLCLVEIEGRRGTAGLLHHPVRSRHEGRTQNGKRIGNCAAT
jgi:formate dehydrogenase major subunit